MEDPNYVCPKCHNTGRVREKDGTVHCCFDCLKSGRMDEHDKIIKDSGIRW